MPRTGARAEYQQSIHARRSTQREDTAGDAPPLPQLLEETTAATAAGALVEPAFMQHGDLASIHAACKAGEILSTFADTWNWHHQCCDET